MKMKWKALSIIVCLALILSVVPGVAIANAQGEFAIVGNSAQAQPGEQVAVQIMLENNPGISALNLYYVYNKDILSLTKVENNISHFTMTNDVTTVWDAASNYDRNGVLATLTFTVAEDAPAGEYNIELKFLSASNDSFEEVTASSGIATIVVSCAHKDTTDVASVDATCDQNGFTAGVYCNDCQTYISGHEEIERTGEHSDADGKWNYDEDGHYCVCACGLMYAGAPHSGGSATCTTKAVCDICHVEYGSVDASAHGQTEVRNASEPSCNQEGYTGDTYCLDCGEKIATGSVISATGKHTGGEATCKDQAVCEVCGTAYGELDTDNHKNLAYFWPVYEATCTEPGYYGDAYCECGEIMWIGQVAPATGHEDSDEDGVCDECDADLSCEHSGGSATCTQQAVCEICGAAYGELDANNHAETEIKGAVEATCGNAGFSGDVCCADCGKVIEAGSMIAATGEHTDADEDALCDDCGAELPKDEEPGEVNPGTGDANLVWLVMITACSALAVVCVGRKKYTV